MRAICRRMLFVPVILAFTACSTQSVPQKSTKTDAIAPERAAQTSAPAKNPRLSGAIASAHPLATRAGMDILANGGNAFDAAIAVAASLGVVEPYSAGLGGGGFWLIYNAKKDQYRFIDAREKAPLAAHRDYFLDEDGKVDRDKAINGPTAAAIPGQPAAFAHIAKNYGKLPLSRTLAAAIKQAQQGFPVDEVYRELAGWRLQTLQRYPGSAGIFLDNGNIPAAGYVIRQPQLATTLQRIAEQGFNGFYHGATAQQLVNSVRSHGGNWSLQDLAEYQVVERQPIHVQYGRTEIISAPPPSSGGVALVEMLNMINYFNWRPLDNVRQTHLFTEVMRRAYKDRAEYLGDPDFVDVPLTELMAEQRAEHWISSINMNQATPSLSLNGPKNIKEGFHTTHFSVLDKDGNMVSATLSINLPFGSAFVADGTGVVLNNEMDDFSAKPSAPNAYGLTGNEANAIAPGKRPLSSMTPTIVNSPDSTAIIGTPGGSRIISMVFLGVLEHLQKKPVTDWVSRQRFHHQYLPDVLQYEPGAFSDEEKEALQSLGHTLREVGYNYGNMQAIRWDKKSGRVTAAADPRGIGEAAVGGVRISGAK